MSEWERKDGERNGRNVIFPPTNAIRRNISRMSTRVFDRAEFLWRMLRAKSESRDANAIVLSRKNGVLFWQYFPKALTYDILYESFTICHGRIDPWYKVQQTTSRSPRGILFSLFLVSWRISCPTLEILSPSVMIPHRCPWNVSNIFRLTAMFSRSVPAFTRANNDRVSFTRLCASRSYRRAYTSVIRV